MLLFFPLCFDSFDLTNFSHRDSQFGSLFLCMCVFTVDHLVNNAGIASICMFEDVDDIADFRSIMVFFGFTLYLLVHLNHIKLHFIFNLRPILYFYFYLCELELYTRIQHLIDPLPSQISI